MMTQYRLKIQVVAKQEKIPGDNDKRLTDPRCATCSDDCPPYCGPYYTTPHPVTEPPCHDCDDTCPPYHKPTTTKFPNLPSITYSTNCDFCDHDLYTLTCVATPFDCAGCCAADSRCSHFTYIANLKGGTCVLKKAFGSGGAWASSVPSPSPYVCGYIPSRALIGIFLNVCVGLNINTDIFRTGTA
jgi:hypothetical protein